MRDNLVVNVAAVCRARRTILGVVAVTVYAACYVALAETLDVTLLTGDGRLARAPGLRCHVEMLRPATLSGASSFLSCRVEGITWPTGHQRCRQRLPAS